MKVNFDREAIDYLINDMTMVFRENQMLIDKNQINITKKVAETRELVSILSELYNENSSQIALDCHLNEKKLLSEVDYLEVIVNTLDTEIENMLQEADFIENKLINLQK